MDSSKRCKCCKENAINERKKTTNFIPRVVKGKENHTIQERSSARATSFEEKLNCRYSKQEKKSETITQCSVNRNQNKANVYAIDSKAKVVTRPPLIDLKKKPSNVSCCTTVKNCTGASRKVKDLQTQNLNTKRRNVSLAASTVKNVTTTSYKATSNISTKSRPLKKSSSFDTTEAAVKPRKSVQKVLSTSLIPVNELQHLNIPPKQELEKVVNLIRGSDCISPILEESVYFTPNADVQKWIDQSSQFVCKENEEVKNIKEDDSELNFSIVTQIIFDGIPSLKKKTLKKQLSVSSGYKGVVNLDPYTNKSHPRLLYSDYMIDIIQNIIATEGKYKINGDFLKYSNKSLPICRTALINWLIKLDQYLNSDASVLFLCIRLFDKLLTITEIPQEQFQLTGIVTYWIASKFIDSRFLLVTELQKFSCNHYSAKFIINHERKILQILNYDICSVEEPIIFVRYYIYNLKVEESNNLSFCANYLLDCLATCWDINTFPLSVQASGAVFLSLKFLGIKTIFWDQLKQYPGYHSQENLYFVNEKILQTLLLIQDANYKFREIFYKYASEKYNFTSIKVYESFENLEK